MTVREYISDLQIRLGNLLDWFIEGARLLGNFQWLDLTIPQAIFTGFFFWCIYLATKGEGYDRYSNFSDRNISEPGYLEAKNLAELNFKFFLSFLFNLFSGFVVIGVIFLMLYDEINYMAMYSWVLLTWLLIGVGTYNRRRIILKDRESFVVETEPSSEASTEGEREGIKPIEFKINEDIK